MRGKRTGFVAPTHSLENRSYPPGCRVAHQHAHHEEERARREEDEREDPDVGGEAWSSDSSNRGGCAASVHGRASIDRQWAFSPANVDRFTGAAAVTVPGWRETAIRVVVAIFLRTWKRSATPLAVSAALGTPPPPVGAFVAQARRGPPGECRLGREHDENRRALEGRAGWEEGAWERGAVSGRDRDCGRDRETGYDRRNPRRRARRGGRRRRRRWLRWRR